MVHGAKIANILYLRGMKQFVFALLLSIPIIRFSFAQTEIIANDYYDIEFFDSNKSKDVPDEFDASNHENGFPYKICDICIVSFDSQMNCIKTHIHFTQKNNRWFPLMESYHGKIEFTNDSIVSYTSNDLVNEKDRLKRAFIRIAFFPCPMAAVEEVFIIRSSSIQKAETGWTLYQLENLQLNRSELRELKTILKLCGLQMKNNRIIYPVKID